LRRTVDVPIGRGVGGGSNINAGLCMAPCQDDFGKWPEPWKSQWMKSVHELQQRLVENKCLWNASNGERIRNVDDLKKETPQPEIVSDDKAHVVPCLAKSSSRNGHLERANYYQGLVEPLLYNHLHAKNAIEQCTNSNNSHPPLGNTLHWLCKREAQRLVMDDNHVVTAVEVLDLSTGIYTTLRVRKEVILCAGALETPALLLVSGIGPRINICSNTNTQKADEKRRELPGVGENLRDHVILPRVFWGPPPSSIFGSVVNGVHRAMPFSIQDDNYLLMVSTTTPNIALHFALRIVQQYYDKFVSCLLSFWLFDDNPLAVYFKRVTNILWKIIERLLYIVVMYTPICWLLKYGLTTLNLALVNPQSAGRLCLKSKTQPSRRGPWRRENVDIHLDLGYLDCSHDIAALWKGWVASTALYPDFFSRRIEAFPGGSFRFAYGYFGDHEKKRQQHHHNQNWFSPFALDTCLPFFHWCGTCSMQTTDTSADDDNDKVENSWVVDSSLRVRGIGKLRICDASVFPNNLSVPPALACAALGHLFGKKLLLQGRASDNNLKKWNALL